MINLNDFSRHLENHYSLVTRRFATAETVSLEAIKMMIDHGLTTEAISVNIVRFAERVSLVDRMLLLADIMAELRKLISKGRTDENIKAACLRLGWELADFMPNPANYEKQISIGEIRPHLRPDDQADDDYIGLTE